ncbi:MAG TPA: hypothetical protein PKW95_05640 [bacterium]|nr:hypothetical protein [bacterium]
MVGSRRTSLAIDGLGAPNTLSILMKINIGRTTTHQNVTAETVTHRYH